MDTRFSFSPISIYWRHLSAHVTTVNARTAVQGDQLNAISRDMGTQCAST